MSVDNAKTVCLGILKNNNFVIDSDIFKAMESVCLIYPSLSDFEKDLIISYVASQVNVRVGEGTYLNNDEGHQPWLNDRKSEIEWHYWNRYRRYLEIDKAWSPPVTARLNEVTDQILGFLEDPQRSAPWDIRGMVVGEVQSGKTGNYTGVICKAIDAGYKVIIVLAGLHNSLRSQTQLRLEQECIGRDTSDEQKKVGVGKYILHHDARPVHQFTSNTENGDFGVKASKTGFIEPGSDPVIMVIKKNTSVLNNVLRWAKKCGLKDSDTKEVYIHDIPLLLIDDEADNASVDGRQVRRDECGNPVDEENPTTINRKIRELLTIFRKSAYVGYTATPFANIFIYPTDDAAESKYGKDLFPENFILNLQSPSSYTGPVKLFGLDADETTGIEQNDMLPIVKQMDDYEDFVPNKHKKSHFPAELPLSLKNAIRSFILTATVRSIRGQEKEHNSMLIHVTRFTNVQARVKDLVFEELDKLQTELRYSQSNDRLRVVNVFKTLWDDDYVKTSKALKIILPEWSQIEPLLSVEASKIIVKTINGSAGDILDYNNHPNGLKVIAVGGDKLSRGLTLEGLTISYYLRASKMYDTLMQMGRWFGYRPGYIDVCRIYTSEELIKNYRYIALANEELRTEFDIMAARGQTPHDYGLKVRTHPEGLQITSTNKLRNGTSMKVSFSKSLSETTTFYKDATIAQANYDAFEVWVRTLGKPLDKKVVHNFIWQDVEAEKVIEFLNGQRVHPLSRKGDPSLLAEYIKKRKAVDELTSWTVALINNSINLKNNIDVINIAGLDIGRTKRSAVDKDGIDYTVKNRHLISESDEMIDCLEGSTFYNKALDLTIETWQSGIKKKEEAPTKPVGVFVREARSPQKGLLLIYPLKPKYIVGAGNETIVPAVIGYAISFPKTGLEGTEAIEYKVSADYWRIHYGGEDDDD